VRAIVFDRGLRFVGDYPVPEPKGNEALVRVVLAGICNTDIEIVRGYMGFKGVLGHEFVGVVQMVQGKAQHLVGRRVVGEINCACGLCAYCLGGMKTHCPKRTTLGISGKDGAFADYAILPVRNLYAVPDSVTDEEAVFTEPLAAAFEVTEQLHIKPTDKILVMGDGKLGILIALVLSLTQADVTLLGKHKHKQRIAREQGLSVLNLAELRSRREYDVVVEATGRAEGFQMALALVKQRGTVVLKTTVAGKMETNLAPIVVDEIHLVGSRCGPFEPALKALKTKQIDVLPLITAVYPVSKAIEAFNKAREKDSLKTLLSFR